MDIEEEYYDDEQDYDDDNDDDNNDDYDQGDEDDDFYNQESEEASQQKQSDNNNAFTASKFLYGCNTELQYRDDLIGSIQKISQVHSLSFGQALYIMRKNQYRYNKCKNIQLDDYYEQIFNMEEITTGDECQICFSDENLYNQQCGHKFCEDCWKEYLLQKIKEGQDCITRTCMQDGCKQILNLETYVKYLPLDLVNKYKYYLIADSLVVSSYVIACSGKRCSRILKIHESEQNNDFKKSQINVKCECGYGFCSLCRQDSHRPTSCKRMKEWLKLMGGEGTEAMSEAWVKLNTRKCPKCQVDIEKNQGCMHMTCRKCKHEFCWMCLKDYRGHGTCNTFKETDGAVVKEKDDQKQMLEKFNFYSERYAQHKKSLDFAQQQRTLTLQSFENMNNQIDFQQDDKFLVEALELVYDCRKAIAYTYALGYYVDQTKRQFYEFQQGNIEQKLELLDGKITNMDIAQFMDTTSLTQYYHTWRSDLKKLTYDLQSYFSNMIVEFENDLPSCNFQKQNSSKGCKQEQSDIQKAIKLSKQYVKQWRCRHCKNFNLQQNVLCEKCFKQQ